MYEHFGDLTSFLLSQSFSTFQNWNKCILKCTPVALIDMLDDDVSRMCMHATKAFTLFTFKSSVVMNVNCPAILISQTGAEVVFLVHNEPLLCCQLVIVFYKENDSKLLQPLSFCLKIQCLGRIGSQRSFYGCVKHVGKSTSRRETILDVMKQC